MTQSADTRQRVLEALGPHRDELLDQILQGLQEKLFDSRALLRPADVQRLAEEEVSAYFDFLRQPDDTVAQGQGVRMHEAGLEEQAVLDLGRVLRQWNVSHLPNGLLTPGLDIAETYHSALVRDFMRRERAIILKEQERLRSALQKSVGQQTLRMEVAADIARVASSILDLNELLTTSVDLIDERFGFYYVGIFLVDEYDEWAVLRAGTGEPGQEMLRRGHKLKVGGNSMIGWCAAHGEPRIASSVGEEAVRFDNPFLPETQSEMALPLVSRGNVVGAMSVQDRQVNAFSEQDISVLQTVADQLANAVTNARLFAESRARTEELEETYRRQLREEWSDAQAKRKASGHIGYAYDLSRAVTSPADDVWTSEMEQAVSKGNIVALTNREVSSGNGKDGDGKGAELAAPITLRGENIGVLSLQEVDQERQWTEEEIALVEAVSAQAALAIENARLFEETQAEAERRALINDVLQAAASSLDPEAVLRQTGAIISRRLEMPTNILEWDAEEEALRPLTVHDDSGAEVTPTEKFVITQEMNAAMFEAIRTRRLQVLLDVPTSTYGAMAKMAQQLDVQDAAYVPLIARDRVIGVLALGRQTGHPPIDEGEQSFIQIVGVNLSVALENARLYEEAVETAERLREVDKLKSQFLANMSHELRTPLNSIIGFSRVILKGIDGPINDQQQRDLEAIHGSGQHLLGLINDILDISKIEAGKMELNFADVDLAEVVEGVMSTAIALVKDKSVDLQQFVPDDLPSITADERRIRQVLLNLVSNAAKFTEEGYVRVEAERQDSKVLVSVSDTGSGIPQDKLEEMFEPFTQVDSSSTREHEGTGLGLTITRSFVDLHGGEVWAESEVGVGSTFYFTLPIEGPSEEEEEEADEQSAISQDVDEKEGKLVLCVDDDEGVIKLFRRYLSQQGYQVVGLNDAGQVVEEARRLQPYAITLDVMMPQMDGWQVIRDLKDEPETAHIPVVMCTIVSEEEKGMSLGASDYLVKPIMEQELVAALDRLDREEGIHRVLVVDDQLKDRKLLRRMIESQEGYEVIEAAGGEEAITLIGKVRPHIIILDLMMPVVDGFAVLESVKADEATRSIPIIVVTAKELTEEDRQMLNHRIETLIEKGILEREELLEDVAAALRKLDRSS
jgi:signal transduction histidine kinase/CheY-like chemotaxis protein/putative methionine-R-sulfoxide reductase with GAF domain